MTLQDQMMKTYREAVIANPDKVSLVLLDAAVAWKESFRKWEELHKRLQVPHMYRMGDYTERRRLETNWKNAYSRFRRLLPDYTDELRAICTESE